MPKKLDLGSVLGIERGALGELLLTLLEKGIKHSDPRYSLVCYHVEGGTEGRINKSTVFSFASEEAALESLKSHNEAIGDGQTFFDIEEEEEEDDGHVGANTSAEVIDIQQEFPFKGSMTKVDEYAEKRRYAYETKVIMQGRPMTEEEADAFDLSYPLYAPEE